MFVAWHGEHPDALLTSPQNPLQVTPTRSAYSFMVLRARLGRAHKISKQKVGSESILTGENSMDIDYVRLRR